jgi:NAD(P)-dependent dehydrogenase (short-subunit alcohol dehydrogenase family)
MALDPGAATLNDRVAARVREFLDSVQREFGRVDVLVNDAGGGWKV